MPDLYLLWHHYPDDLNDDNAKILGVYSSEQKAQERIDSKYLNLPGFSIGLGEFTIDGYEVDQDDWEH